MAATIKDLGKVTAYAYAKAAGYTGTEEQFQAIFDEFTENAPGLIDRMDTAVARAEAAVTEIDATIQDAVDDAVEEATASAVATANQAVTDAQAAQTAVEGAVTQANAAVTAAQAAQSAAEDAAESFVLDRTLTDSGAAAPADLVGDLKESITQINDALRDVNDGNYTILLDTVYGYVDSTDGTFKPDPNWKRTDKIDISYFKKLVITSPKASNYNAFYKSDGTWLSQLKIKLGTFEYAIPNGAKYMALSNVGPDLDSTKILRLERQLTEYIDSEDLGVLASTMAINGETISTNCTADIAFQGKKAFKNLYLLSGITYLCTLNLEEALSYGITVTICDSSGNILKSDGINAGQTNRTFSYTPSQDYYDAYISFISSTVPTTINIGITANIQSLGETVVIPKNYKQSEYVKSIENGSYQTILTFEKTHKNAKYHIEFPNGHSGKIWIYLRDSNGTNLATGIIETNENSCNLVTPAYENANAKLVFWCDVFENDLLFTVEIIDDDIYSLCNLDIKSSIDDTFMRFTKWNYAKEKIVFPIITDVHMCFGEWRGFPLNYACGYMSDLFGFNFVANLGDIGFDMAYDEEGYMQAERKNRFLSMYAKYQGECKVPCLYAKGNHEVYFKNGSELIDDYCQGVLKDTLISPIKRFFSNYHIEDGKMYGYYDIPNTQIRVIILDSNDVTNLDNLSNTNGYSITELTWLRDLLANTPNGYSIIMLSHKLPHWREQWKINDGGTYRDPTEADFANGDVYGHKIIMPMLKGYVAKTSGSATDPQLNQSLSWDFTSANGTLIAMFCGHSHFDYDVLEDGVRLITTQGMGSINLTTEKPSWGVYSGIEPICVDVVAICPSESEIKIFRIGAGGSERDRTFTY